ncbi:MAG: protein-disulfide reductase DsbD N-terminal domain-containing protein, partial [Muribaculaceae bacterium]|nr:protein-disulfide reductase DsbD N-terminal domain-containing protein [Muribaculaceae bacterium]
MKRLTLSVITAVYATIISIAGFAADAVKWDIKLVGDGTDSPSVVATATIDPGYHLYSIDNPAGGSNPLVFFFDTKGCETIGTPTADHPYTKEFDDTFEVDQHFYANKVTFTQKLKPTAANYTVDVEIKGQACNDTGCTQVYGGKSLTGKAPAAAAAPAAVAAHPATHPPSQGGAPGAKAARLGEAGV